MRQLTAAVLAEGADAANQGGLLDNGHGGGNAFGKAAVVSRDYLLYCLECADCRQGIAPATEPVEPAIDPRKRGQQVLFFVVHACTRKHLRDARKPMVQIG
jgi:hypothetical protein